MTTRIDPIKRGAAFDFTVVIPEEFADGYFAGAVLASQVRTSMGLKVADLEAAWLDPVTTREIRLYGDTSAWPLGRLFTDVRITRASDRLAMFTETVRFRLQEPATRG